MDRMNLGRSGWGIMIGWAFWVVIFPEVFELFKLISENRSGDSSFF